MLFFLSERGGGDGGVPRSADVRPETWPDADVRVEPLGNLEFKVDMPPVAVVVAEDGAGEAEVEAEAEGEGEGEEAEDWD